MSIWNGKDINVLIYSKEDLELIKGNMLDSLFEELSLNELSISANIKIYLRDIIDYGKSRDIIEVELDENFLDIISNLLEMEDYESFNGYQIWIEKRSTLEDYQ